MEELLPARQANISQHLAVLRHARLVDYAQDGTLRCYYLCRPLLVVDMLALTGRNDPIVKRSPEEIQADKQRLERALARSAAEGAASTVAASTGAASNGAAEKGATEKPRRRKAAR
jgi:DNA-binding transcriptional ArsR family regulator